MKDNFIRLTIAENCSFKFWAAKRVAWGIVLSLKYEYYSVTTFKTQTKKSNKLSKLQKKSKLQQ